MNNYKLIKLKEGYIIISDEEIENYYFNNHTKEIYLEIHPKRLEVTNKELNKEIIFKIIASTFIPQLPNIDFNNLEEEFGVINWLNIAIQEEEQEIENNKEYHSTSWYNGFKLGWQKVQELNKDKLYTADELIKNFKPAFDKFINDGGAIGSNENWVQFQNIVEWFPKYLQSLHSKTIWDIEIEEYCGYKDCTLFGCQKYACCKYENLQIPKILNNKIKILKIK